MVDRGPSAATPPPRNASTRTDLPLSDVAAHPGLAATALDAEGADARQRSGGPSTEPTGAKTQEDVDPWIGRTLANVYKVDAKIGEGGMGAVYRATHVHLGKQVAVKVLTDAIAQKRDAVERLRQEAIAASSIDHDNIVDVVSFDRYDDGSVFIVMELLRGESLASRIEQLRDEGKTLPLHDTVQIALQICDALGAAHERGIVHRDLKPENVFLAKKGERERVKVLDFGISKIKTADAEQVRMTRTGQLVGTPLYMSPEQARGEPDVDRRVDVYALGVMLFEMITGAPPFDGRNYFELLWKHGNEPPPSIRERAPESQLGAELDEAIRRALAKEPAERFQTMGELATALRAATPEISLPGQSIPPELRSSRPSGSSSGTSSGEGPRVTPTATPEATPSAIPVLEAQRTEAPPPERSPLMWIGVVGILAVSAAGGFALVTGGSEPTPPPATTRPEAQPAIGPAQPAVGSAEPRAEVTPSEATPPQPEIAPLATVTVSFGSDPLGAVVMSGEDVLCTTPCLHDLPVGAEATLTFRREGYHDTIERVTPADGLTVTPRLRARRRATGGGESGAGAGPAIKTTL
jgi:serine/threonine-protein kinase